MKDIIKTWDTNLKKIGLKQNIIKLYLKQINILLSNNVPIILDFEHLAKLLGRKESYLASLINSPRNHYREFQIPKRKGGKRIIDAPYPALLECQIWIYENILKKIPIHFSAQAFTNKKSILTNALIHKNEDFLLKLDLKDFFPSIKINRVIQVFKNLGYNHRVSFYLSQICCIDDYLPQGAPTSPPLSNIIAHKLDKRLIGLAKVFKFKYSRYADDLAFSGSKIPIRFISYVRDIVEDENFLINEKKTRLLGPTKRKIITGISISNKELKIPKNYKREIRKEVHFIRKYGLYSHLSKRKIKNPLYLESLLGKITFWLSVEPKNAFALESQLFLKNLLYKNR